MAVGRTDRSGLAPWKASREVEKAPRPVALGHRPAALERFDQEPAGNWPP
ncbi:hypothetical protein OH809_21325 [Streptomyces sp. NBC_00873]|nr:hypothetical protein OH809_21325 [Streptomyces sp. NBC_00873]WTA45017.1 hypothetical protein OH821_22275 [Streptomyces sp. NBC_00842]